MYTLYLFILTLFKCCWYWNSVFAIWAKSFTRFEWSIMLTFERIPHFKSTCMIRFRRYVECKPNSKFFMVIRYQTCSWYSHVFFHSKHFFWHAEGSTSSFNLNGPTKHFVFQLHYFGLAKLIKWVWLQYIDYLSKIGHVRNYIVHI